MSASMSASAMDIDHRKSSQAQLPDHHTATQSTISATNAVSDDPVSSLRALALKTRKTRKPTAKPTTTLPQLSRPLPPPDNSFQLDYGQEDGDSLAPAVPASISKPAVHKINQATAAPPVEDAQMREEGEISDEEHISPPPPATKPLSRPRPSPPRPTVITQDVKTRPQQSTPTRSIFPKIESPPHNLLDRISDQPTFNGQQAGPSSYALGSDHPFVDDVPYFIDADHVRPGLASRCLARTRFATSLQFRSEPRTI